MSGRTVCVVGSGGREHALALALARDAEVVVTPGNPGITRLSGERVTCSPAPATEIDADLYVIGPEAPLVAGLADRLRARGRLVFGPGADGARLEGSKAWMKETLAAAGVPTAAHQAFGDARAAAEWLRARSGPWVVKTDGLAAGKGVLVTADLDEAIADVEAKLSGASFGDAGRRVVLEEGLTGPELSVMAVCDGTRAVPLAAAQDFKRVADGDRGPNTGGMGAYSPVPLAGESVMGQVMDTAVEPTLAALARQGIDYRGVLYAGLMLTPDGLRVIEFNVRFGDPETQVVAARWQGEAAAVLAAAAAGDVRVAADPVWSADAAVCVVLAAEGYPEAPRTGDLITGLAAASAMPGVQVMAGGVAAGELRIADGPVAGRERGTAGGRVTAGDRDTAGGRVTTGSLVTAGGRVLGVTALGPDLAAARALAYEAASVISWPGATFRRDIALAASCLPTPQPTKEVHPA